ncbi:MAG: hypothetical protein OEY22_11560 [Candidatus Bathyarchaeota archaeon]|nr:hypothetical protein [Candidatus Bathyarchaeota archaeon]MDH5787830.1 hypothetical protein [Candidatus Bathyarchaeota archaeon]
MNVKVLIEGFPETYKRELARRVALNRQILTFQYWFLPVDDTGHEDFVPVGRGVPSSEICGRWRSLVACKNKEGHKGKLLKGADVTNKMVVRHKHWWCHKASCPICFARGWSPREARNILGRCKEAEKRGLGIVEHVTVSVAVKDRDLRESVSRKNCREALFDRGVGGGAMIFHGYRIDWKRKCLVWSPHYHALGVVSLEGGFDRCRDCVHDCRDCGLCDGFKVREVRGFAKDGYLVKVHETRKTVFGTAYYQLNHATIRVGLKRFHVVTWFGSMSYRMFEGEKLVSEDVCSVCGGEMVRCFHAGKRRIVKDVGDIGYVACFVDDEFDERGEPNYVEIVGSRGFG